MSETTTNPIGDGENTPESRNLESIQREVERKELQKKFDSQKKEIKGKIFEAKKALDKESKEMEEDFEKTLLLEPELMTEADKLEYIKYMESEKEKAKKEIEALQAHENELDIDYEDLKTEPKVQMTNDYAKTINHAITINSTLMKMLFDYFNYLNDNFKYQRKANIIIDMFTTEHGLPVECFPHNTGMEYFVGNVVINFKKITRAVVTLKKFYSKTDGFVYQLCLVSEGKTYLNPDYIGKKILFNAISHSNIKGSYITMGPGSISWNIEKLEDRTFEDIYLPKSIMETLQLYTKHYDKSGNLLRYLMIGNPGTGKTESTLALANYLKLNGVTVIKTMVCDALREKLELAELLAPAVVIFDDIDLSLGSRKKGVFSGGLGQFLDVLDGTEKIRKDVGIIATTNSLELLDMAAQRPGRFNQLLAFDSLTRGNVRDIIKKSLKRNFSDSTEEGYSDESFFNHIDNKPFYDIKVIDAYYNAAVTGAHIYNSTYMLRLRVEDLELTDITPDWIVSEIEGELKTLARIRKTDYLQDKMNNEKNSSNIGFGMKNAPDEDEELLEESVMAESIPTMNFESKSMEADKGYSHRSEGTSYDIKEESLHISPESSESSDGEQTHKSI